MYVCPEDYLEFSAAERRRWMALLEMPDEPSAPPLSDVRQAPLSPRSPARTAEELIALLAARGLAGWAFLVRDVAEGRVRRLQLHQLPADPEIREALLTYLHSVGASVSVSRIIVGGGRRPRRKG